MNFNDSVKNYFQMGKNEVKNQVATTARSREAADIVEMEC